VTAGLALLLLPMLVLQRCLLPPLHLQPLLPLIQEI
jgi:hypothetical protein